jgi:hypothetical protein
MRYTAHTLDGTTVLTAESAQQIADALIDRTKAGRRPHIAYIFDNEPGSPWPYTTWKQSAISGIWIGSPWKTFDEVVTATRGI